MRHTGGLNVLLNKIRSGFVFTVLKIAISINTYLHSGLTELEQALPRGTKPTCCEGVTFCCGGSCNAAAHSSVANLALSLALLLKGVNSPYVLVMCSV